MLRCQCPSVCPSVCDGSALWSRCMPGRGEGSSRAMLATARPSCWDMCADRQTDRQYSAPLLGDWVISLTHTLGWKGMGWAALVTQCISLKAFTHWVTSASHPIQFQRVCECTIIVTHITLWGAMHHVTGSVHIIHFISPHLNWPRFISSEWVV